MKINSSQQLASRLDQLEKNRDFLEEKLQRDFSTVAQHIRNPASYIRNTVSDLASDKKFLSDLIALVFHFAAVYAGAKTKGGSGKADFLKEVLGLGRENVNFSLKELFHKIVRLFSTGSGETKTDTGT